MRVRTVLLLAAVQLPLLAAAQVFRCEAASKVEYSDSPCAGGAGRIVLVSQNAFPGPGARERELLDENRRLRQRLDADQATPAVTTGRTDADLAAERGGSYECARARRNYEVGASSYRNTDADDLAVYIACGIRPPQRMISVSAVQVASAHRWPGMLQPRRPAARFTGVRACPRSGCL